MLSSAASSRFIVGTIQPTTLGGPLQGVSATGRAGAIRPNPMGRLTGVSATGIAGTVHPAILMVNQRLTLKTP